MSSQIDIEFPEDGENGLPSGWQLSTLARLGEWTSGGTPKRSNPGYYGGDVPWVKTGDLHDGPVRDIPECITEEGLTNSSAKLFPPGTLLIAMYGATIGKLGTLITEAATNQACAALLRSKVNREVLPYAFYYLMSQREVFRNAGKGGAQPNISQTILKAHPVPVAPLPEQHRIVAEIEKHFTRLDDAVATLERVQAQLKRARASVLKAAVEGRLVPTEAELARAEGRSYEPASVLLERILEERRKRHEEAQVGAKRKKKYKEPVEPETEGLPELPEGWVWACAGQCVDSQVGHAFKSHDFADHGVNLLRGDNIGHGVLRWGERRRCIGLAAVDEFPHLLMSVADIVLAMDRPVVSTGLKYAVVKALDLPALLVQRVVRLRPSVNTGYFLLNLQSPSFITHLQAKAKGGGVPHISEGQVKAFPLPLPPLAEQHRIVPEVERRLSVLDALEQTVERNLARSTRLRQSILKRAFEGKLVPQDPNDEPASELLARIAAERPPA